MSDIEIGEFAERCPDNCEDGRLTWMRDGVKWGCPCDRCGGYGWVALGGDPAVRLKDVIDLIIEEMANATIDYRSAGRAALPYRGLLDRLLGDREVVS